jgi:hypothetical protein
MTSPSRSFALGSLALALVASSSVAHAQRGELITVTSAKVVRTSVTPGEIITTAFTVKNGTRDSVMIQPVLSLPNGWHTVMTVAPSILGPVSSDLWLISVVAPANAPAGRYVIRLRLGVGTPRTVVRGDVWGVGMARDSVVVSVGDRHDVAIHAAAHPTFVMGGDSYTTKFVVRNRGNVAARITVRASSNQGASPTLNVSVLNLLAGQSDTVTATVAIPADVARSSQQLLEVVAIDQAADSVRADASVETTIIPRMNTADPDFWTVPAELSLRASAPGTGVSPFVASGAGLISQSGDATVDFSFRNSAGPASIFGERDEYRFGLKNKNAGVRLGDNSYGFSLLTSSGQQSTGGELRGSAVGLTSGAYVERNRWTPNSPTEIAAMVGTEPTRDLSASAVVLERGTSGMDARVFSAAARGSIFGAHLEAEAAKSDSQLVVGDAAVARLYGNLPTLSYDFGAQKASDAFAGVQHASGDAHASLSGQSVGPLILSAMGSIHLTDPTPQSAGFGQQLATSTASANLRNGSGLDFERFDRRDRGTMNPIIGNQQALRLRVHIAAGPLDLLGSVQRGIVAELDSTQTRPFTSFSGSARAAITSDQYIALFTEVTDGRALAAGGIGTATVGGNTDLHLAGTSLRLTGSATAQRDNLAAWVGQADVTVEHQVLRSIVALRGRIGLSGTTTIASTNAFYLEVRTPLHIPTRRMIMSGRARAQVVDAETGKGVAGAMVRMGELSAITDKNGSAIFSGLHAGQYNAVVEGGLTAGQLVSGGTAITVPESRAPVAFTLSLARGAHVAATIHRYEAVSFGAGPRVADSLIDVGAVSQAVVSLASQHDTLWQTSDDRGRIDFGSLAPGHYTMSVVGDNLPEFTAFEYKHIDIDVTAGEQREVELRVLPQQRSVQFIGNETVLVAAPAKPPVVKPHP